MSCLSVIYLSIGSLDFLKGIMLPAACSLSEMNMIFFMVIASVEREKQIICHLRWKIIHFPKEK